MCEVGPVRLTDPSWTYGQSLPLTVEIRPDLPPVTWALGLGIGLSSTSTCINISHPMTTSSKIYLVHSMMYDFSRSSQCRLEVHTSVKIPGACVAGDCWWSTRAGGRVVASFSPISTGQQRWCIWNIVQTIHFLIKPPFLVTSLRLCQAWDTLEVSGSASSATPFPARMGVVGGR